ncbi:hypothetical protein KX729_22285 [Rhizobium sp. XQZ8]|uniref:hypothetical protein n=1 Tax=Rhizobium populisoli TaxID=2859785 RepID=UPI001CA55476|nr:hypothetical protein [Rhizobium populisoli]MBW6424194.1 hypothetical protein [Rhizobium populisoli]
MISPEKGLAEALDAWALEGRALITEHAGDIVVGKLSAADALELVRSLEALGWNHSIEDGSPAIVTKDQLDAEYEPFRITAEKPAVPKGRDHILTNVGLKDWLGRPPAHSIVEASRLQVGFGTLSVKFVTRELPGSFEPEVLSSDPRAVVKDSGQVRVVPADVSPWITGRAQYLDPNSGQRLKAEWSFTPEEYSFLRDLIRGDFKPHVRILQRKSCRNLAHGRL